LPEVTRLVALIVPQGWSAAVALVKNRPLGF
jgi:hypothetical protein